MQNDSNVEMKQTEISNPEYVLTIETHEGLMLTHPLSMEEAKVIGKMALSGTARKDLLKNFFHSVKDKYAEFSHIKKWLESILASTKTEFFTVQMEKINHEQENCLPLGISDFEAKYKKYAPEWALEKNADGSYKHHATDCAFKTWLPMHETILKLQHQVYATTLENNCMIGQTWFLKGTPVSALIEFAENIYKSEVVSQNSKIKFGTDDGENWWAHDVPFFGTVQMNWDRTEREWDIYLDKCWQGPFNSKSECIQHLEECIQEKREEEAQGVNN